MKILNKFRKPSLSVFLTILFALGCETPENEQIFNDLDSKVDILNFEDKSINSYDVIASGIGETNFTSLDYENNPILKKLLISKIDFSLNDKLFTITDTYGEVYEYNLIENQNLDYEGYKNEIIYTLEPKTIQGRTPACRFTCYLLFAAMVSSDGPAPIADILAAAVLSECLDLCEK